MVPEEDMPGFKRAMRREDRQQWIDTSELFFEDVRVPAENVLGEVGRGFEYLVSNLPQERMSIAVHGQAMARGARLEAVDYAHERRAFGQAVAECSRRPGSRSPRPSAEVEVSQAYLDQCLRQLVAEQLTPEDAAIAKPWATETQGKVTRPAPAAVRRLRLHAASTGSRAASSTPGPAASTAAPARS